MPPSYQLIASDQSWIEGEALRQLDLLTLDDLSPLVAHSLHDRCIRAG